MLQQGFQALPLTASPPPQLQVLNCATTTTHLSSMLPQAFLSILIVYLTLLCIVQRLVCMVDLCKVLCCFLLFLVSASYFVCTRSSTARSTTSVAKQHIQHKAPFASKKNIQGSVT
jgi:hypothetical protein